MPTTAEYKFPYPADGDAPDGPAQIKALAELLEKVEWLERSIKDGAVTSRKLKLTSGIIRSTANVALKSAWQDLNGTTLGLPSLIVKSKLIVVTAFQFQCAGIGANVEGTLKVDGTPDETHLCGYGWGASTAQSNFDGLGEVYEQELTPGIHTIALAAKGTKATEGPSEIEANKGCSALWFLHAV